MERQKDRTSDKRVCFSFWHSDNVSWGMVWIRIYRCHSRRRNLTDFWICGLLGDWIRVLRHRAGIHVVLHSQVVAGMTRKIIIQNALRAIQYNFLIMHSGHKTIPSLFVSLDIVKPYSSLFLLIESHSFSKNVMQHNGMPCFIPRQKYLLSRFIKKL